jgi:hypothetical protein
MDLSSLKSVVISEPLKRKLLQVETLFAHYPIGNDAKAPCIDPIIIGKTWINSGGGSHYDQAMKHAVAVVVHGVGHNIEL